MRFFLEIQYNGSSFNGWQRQTNAPSVQETIETAISTICQTSIEILGCGRTDTGVHASSYFAHFDLDGDLPENFLFRLNRLLPDTIVAPNCTLVHDDAHARFDASLRAYTYYIAAKKDPFRIQTCTTFLRLGTLHVAAMNEAAAMLPKFEFFDTFCKTNSNNKTTRCAIRKAFWDDQLFPSHLTFHIESDRFLRGMIRMIVGAHLDIGLGKLSLRDYEEALTNRERLKRSALAPADGLFLSKVEYPFFNGDLL